MVEVGSVPLASSDGDEEAGVPITPTDLVFDDEPLEAMGTGAAAARPTPASAVDLWRLRIDRSDAVARAVAAIFSRTPDCLQNGDDLEGIEEYLRRVLDGLGWLDGRRASTLAALAALAEMRGNIDVALADLRQAWDIQRQRLGPTHLETEAAAERLARLLDQAGRGDEAGTLRQALDLDRLLRQPGNAVTLRSKALERFLDGRYNDAERIYTSLLQQGFQLASTHCHLARVYLRTGREQEAARQAALAWEHRAGAPAYIVPRILFFRLVARMLEGKDYGELLRQIERALRAPGAFESWSMQPVVDHLASRLTAEQRTLLTALVGALGDHKLLRNLAELPSWQQAITP